jgi:tRNA threonylcarbamoyl adenosine modification protein YeaZ
MKILGIESTSNHLSVAVSRDTGILSCEFGENSKKHMVNIIDTIDRALHKAGLDLESLDLLAADIGPGDFTGTRIGLTVAKTLAWTLKKPTYGVNVMDMIALNCLYLNLGPIHKLLEKKERVLIISCLDVRRGEILLGFYCLNPVSSLTDMNFDCRDNGSDDLIYAGDGFSLTRFLPYRLESKINIGDPILSVPKASKIYITGNALAAYAADFNLIAEKMTNICLEYRLEVPDASYLNLCAFQQYQNGGQPEILNPYYVRDFAPFGGSK